MTKSILEINNEQIDLTPVENLEKLVDKIPTRKNSEDRSHVLLEIKIFEEYKKLNDKQKELFVTYLITKLGEISDLYLDALNNPEKILEYKKFYEEIKELVKKYN